MRIETKLVGIDRCLDKFDRLPTQLKLEVLQGTFQAGKYLTKAVRRRFRIQGPAWHPLSAAYSHWRRSVGLGSAILMRTLLLYRSIHFVKENYSTGFVGIDNGFYPPLRGTLPPWKRSRYRRFPRKHFKLGREQRSIATVARIHEYGIGRMPARPFFGPAAIESRRAVKQIYSRALARALKA